MPVTKDQRGFGIYCEFTDTYGSVVKVKQSSAAMYDAVWIFCSNEDKRYPEPSPHLNLEQARAVRDALTEWIDAHDQAPEAP